MIGSILLALALVPLTPTVEICDCELVHQKSLAATCAPAIKLAAVSAGKAIRPMLHVIGGTPPYVWTIPDFSTGKIGDVTRPLVTRAASGNRGQFGESVRPVIGSLNAATDTLTITGPGAFFGCLTVTDSKGASIRAFFEVGGSR
jgi:hypothetical protein